MAKLSADANVLIDSIPSPEMICDIVRMSMRLSHPGVAHSTYAAALHHALEVEPPPFATPEYATIYRTLSAEPRWMAVSLITNAEREGDGSTRLWSLAACSDDAEQTRLLKRHACDESRHALVYLRLLDLSFPGAVAPAFARELRQLSPGFTRDMELVPIEGSPYAKAPTIDDFLQMNIAEIRTAIHHTMQRRALAQHCPTENLARVTKLQEALLSDELRHIAYTAVLIEQIAASLGREDVEQLFRRRFHDFNAITTEELGGNVFDCSVACCAKRPGCRAKASGEAGPTEVVLGVRPR